MDLITTRDKPNPKNKVYTLTFSALGPQQSRKRGPDRKTSAPRFLFWGADFLFRIRLRFQPPPLPPRAGAFLERTVTIWAGGVF